MKTTLVNLYKSYPAIRRLLSIPRSVYESAYRERLSDESWCKLTYKLNHGHALDLSNPTTLNEKIQWLKLYYRRPDYAEWADKFKVREHIKALLGERYLIPLIAHADDPASIDFQSLPFPYIVKPTHSSGSLTIIRKPEDVNQKLLVAECRSWLRSNFYKKSREFPYRSIPPRIVVEKLLTNEDGSEPFDYKFHCINGKVEFIQVDIDRRIDHRRNFYDADWKKLPFVWTSFAGSRPLWPAGRDVQKPEALDEMLQISTQLAKHFPYARIDWYYCRGHVYFGEVTFFHGGGFERIAPIEWDKHYGSKLVLPKPLG